MSAATLQPAEGCTLAAYAAAKELPFDFLERLGLSDGRFNGKPAVRIPYVDGRGQEAAVRFRVELLKAPDSDGRFRWKKGDKPVPYGLDRLAEARAAGCIVLVEGESDAQTLWFHGIPALGLPGASSWREVWAEHLGGIPRILVVIEPDRGGDATRSWLSKSVIRERVHLLTLAPAKDPSELHLAGPDEFESAWQAAVDAAVSWKTEHALEANRELEIAHLACAALASQRDILACFTAELAAAGVSGESRAGALLFLAMVSRVLERPVSVAIKGPSSAGKSYLVDRVLEFFPASSYYALTAMSEMALAYSDESLVHRVLVLFEAAALKKEFAAYLLRSLLSEGRLRYETVEKTKDGIRPRLIERDGPTGLIVTTTATQLHPENETRMFSLTVSDSTQQTHDIMVRTAEEIHPSVDMEPWHALQHWLEGAEHGVTIPFARSLAEAIPPRAVRLRRDFKAVLSLIRSHAILHQATRGRDGEGRIIATVDDYAVVYRLVADLVSEGVDSAVRPTVRETVAAVVALNRQDIMEPTIQTVAGELHLDKSATSRRVRAAIEAGYLKNNEESRRKPARLVVGDPLPEDRGLLPHPDALWLASGCTVAADSGELAVASGRGASGVTQPGQLGHLIPGGGQRTAEAADE